MLLQQVALTELIAGVVRTHILHWQGRPSVNDYSCHIVIFTRIIRVKSWLLSLEVHLRPGLIIFTVSIIRF